MPKRKFAECGSSDGQESGESEDSNCSSVQTDGSTDVAAKAESGPFTQGRKKAKKSVSFKGVTVYYFPRKQGFTCVPSQGGSTLGMSEKHHGMETFSLSEYSTLQRYIHNRYLLDQHNQGKIILPPDKLLLISEAVQQGLGRDAEMEEEDPGVLDEEFGLEDEYYFLQPVPTRQRRIMLRQSGIKKIEPVEKDECKDIRSSREVCGCNCKVFCDPETCICSKAGIKCQVDRLSFPCGCSKDGCANVNGRIEFNPVRVRTHFLHTLMRLELEKKKGQSLDNRGSILKPTRLASCQVKVGLKSSPAGAGSSSQIGDNLCKDSGTTQSVDCNHGNQTESAIGGGSGSKSEVDLSAFNSNERGSCRDCQKSNIGELIMRESQFSSQGAELESCMGPTNRTFTMHEEPPIGLPTVTNAGESLPQLMMFSDDEEAYNGENAAAMFQFPKEESSYSESSDCSSEGAGSVEEQPIYRNYHNFPAPPPYDANTEPPHCGLRGQNVCDYQSQQDQQPPQNPTGSTSINNTSPPQDPKYPNANPNGYKLEPISEILTPLRYPGYPSGPTTAPTGTAPNGWAREQYCPEESYPKLAPHGTITGPSGDCSSEVAISRAPYPPGTDAGNALISLSEVTHSAQYLYPTTTCPEAKPATGLVKNAPLVNGGDHTEAVSSNGMSYTTCGHYGNSFNHDNQTSASVTSTTTTGSPQHQSTHKSDDKPKYHELKSSSMPGNKSSLAFLSTASQVTSSFDLTAQNTPSTVASFQLGSTVTSAQACSTEMSSSGTAELFGFPRAQTAQPVTTFDLPNSTTEGEAVETDTNGNEAESCCLEPRSPSCEQSSTNFGEIIKESIVETVSA